jgi:DNA-binding response OmpR family regulator
MSHYKILIIEDDDAIRRGMCDALKYAGHTATDAANGPDGLRAALDGNYDLLLLDIVLPGLSGLEILKTLQDERPGTPVILLTAKGGEADRVAGLKLGADDYVVKPFSIKELLARIEAVLRRSPARPVEVHNVPIPGGEIDLTRRVVRFKDGKENALTEREYELLRYLTAHIQRVVGRAEILQRVWKIDPRAIETRTIDMTVARLREKIRDRNCTLILTVRGRGYQFIKTA